MENTKYSLEIYEQELIAIYYKLPHVLARRIIKVSIIEEQTQFQSNEVENQLFLQETNNGNYWIVPTENKLYWLLPKDKLKINSFLNIDKLKLLFDCIGSQTEDTRDFILIKPAKVSQTPDGRYWKIEQRGVLEFANNSASSQLESELEQTKNKYQQLQHQFDKLTIERNQLHSQVAELAYKSLQEIRSHLVTRDEFEKQIQFEKDEREKLYSLSRQQKEYLQTIIERVHILTQAEQEFRQKQSNFKDAVSFIIEELSKQKEFNSKISITQGDIKTLKKIVEKIIVYVQNQNTEQEKLLTFEEYKLIELYFNNENSLLTHVIEVNATEDSINMNRLTGQNLLLTKIHRGNYWIVNQGGFNYLVPKKNLIINQHSYWTAEALFECREYQQGRSQKFRLLKPTKVFELPEDEKWRLDNKGILEFY
ncbi:MAG: hypothetical protein RMZ69_03765 [Nostoc sp. ChiQUE01a]|nr:hypothetical protein [Nostoc sp. ChiQUE01a]